VADAPELKDLTAAQWTDTILNALKAHDVKGVAALVHGMAIYHPHEAEEIRQTLLLGTSIAQAQR
jgi:hypothetical protein